MSEEQAMNYPLNRAFALKAWLTENHPWGRMIYETPGYLGQEIAKQSFSSSFSSSSSI